jgi:predicted RecB family nuclease
MVSIMTITDQLFEAYLQCPTKCFLRARGEPPTGNVYSDWVRGQSELYRSVAARRLLERLSAIRPPSGSLESADAISANWRCAVEVLAQSPNLESHIHAVERIPSQVGALSTQLVPIRFVRANRPNNTDKLMLAFDALVLSETMGRQVAFGRIIHGEEPTSSRIKTAVLAGQARQVIERIGKLLQTEDAPDLVLNRHCGECEFQARCRRKAKEIDELSLLSGMKPAERERHRSKGIFTVNQLSYTFRQGRQPSREKPIAKPHSFALQALAIRENTVYVHGSPHLPDAETSVYLDIEGVSSSGPFYLLGALIVAQGREEFHSFWADQRPDETTAFTQFVEVISQLPNVRVFHYGAYDAAALKLVQTKLPDFLQPKIDLILQRCVNVLTQVHQHIYFPTYSNGLKDICHFLGCERTYEIPNGLQSMIWRKSWEANAQPETKAALLRYNKEDCLALRRLCEFIKALENPDANPVVRGFATARTDAIAPEEVFRASFG